jgi:nitrogen fixation NifU-like protein
VTERDIDELYQAAILDRAKDERWTGDLPPPASASDHQHRRTNPLCGDRCEVAARDGLAVVRTKSRGCAISVASASIMAELVEGGTVTAALELAERFRAALLSSDRGDDLPPSLRPLLAVRPFKSRHRCALLPWEALDRLVAASNEDR